MEPLLELTKEDNEYGDKYLEGIDWYVCLHVREPGGRWNHPQDKFRNCDVNTYIPAIKSITDKGGYVIRMGHPEMTPLPEMPNVRDYALSKERDLGLDIILCARCMFFLGTSSGLYAIAMAFGVPVVLTNVIAPAGIYYLTSQDMFIPKLFKRNGELLRFDEMLDPLISTIHEQYHYDRHGLEIIDNTSEEIKDLVDEMLERR